MYLRLGYPPAVLTTTGLRAYDGNATESAQRSVETHCSVTNEIKRSGVESQAPLPHPIPVGVACPCRRVLASRNRYNISVNSSRRADTRSRASYAPHNRASSSGPSPYQDRRFRFAPAPLSPFFTFPSTRLPTHHAR